MGYSRYGGQWAKGVSRQEGVPLKPPIDPLHLTPPPDEVVTHQSPLWQESTPVQTLPSDMTGEPFATPIGGGGPHENIPRDPMIGVGVGPGLTIDQSRELLAIHGVDDGSIAARQWQVIPDRDGPYNLAHIPDTPGDGVSPETPWLRYARGVGVAHDPNARSAGRFKRWVSRFIDMHRYEVDYRPHRARYAITASMTDHGVGIDSQYYPDTVPAQIHNPSTRDKFVQGQARQQPTGWEVNDSGDPGAIPHQETVGSFGLTSWGF